jgi:hypothetical protein
MARLALRILTGGFAFLGLLAILSCGSHHLLTGITVTPNNTTANDPIAGDQFISFTATGHFVHPPGDRDITNEVVWSVAYPTIFTVDSKTGVATYVGGCGTNLPVTATTSTDLHLPPSGNIAQGTAVVNIKLGGTC